MSVNQFPIVIDKNFVKFVQLVLAANEDNSNPKLFEKLLDKDYDINYRIPDSYSIFFTNWAAGCTIFQLVYSEPEISKLLIENGADYLAADKKGSTVLLKEIASYRHKSYLNSLKLKITDKDLTANTVLSAHINSGNPTNVRNIYGLSHFHVACMYNQVDAVKFFIDNGVSINETVNNDSKFYPGYSALHFAAKSCAIETVDLLITSGANMFAKDSKGRNPLHVLIFEERKTLVSLDTLSRIPALDAENSRYSSLCKYDDKLIQVIYLLMEKMNDQYGYLDYNTGLSYIHVLCLVGGIVNVPIVKHSLDLDRKNLTQSVDMDSKFWPGYTPLHFAAHSTAEIVELLVKEGADLCAKDANGLTPFEIFMKEFTLVEVHRILSLLPNNSSIIFSDGKTKLFDFIQAMQEPDTFEDLLRNNVADINMIIPFDSPICAGYTPLHLTVMCTERPMSFNSKNSDNSYVLFGDRTSEYTRMYLSRVDMCLSFNPDVTIRDARGSTPLHWAFRLQQTQAVHRLLERHETSSNFIDEQGLSHLHIACAAKNEKVVKNLLSGGANVNEVATSNYTWLEVDMTRVWAGGQVQNYFINKGSTPLHFASSVQLPEVIQILIDHGANVLAEDNDGFNPLERMLKVSIFKDSECHKPSFLDFNKPPTECVEKLVLSIGKELADSKPKRMLYCYSLLQYDALVAILNHYDESAMKILASVGITALHVACFTRNLLKVNQLAEEMGVNTTVDLESPLWPGCTPLHLFIKERPMHRLDASPANVAIVEKLLERGANVAALNAKGETPIHETFYHAKYYPNKLLEHLKDFSINPMSRRGYTHLHIASAYGATSVVQKLLNEGAAIDQPSDYLLGDFGGFTALHFAVQCRQQNTVDVLLKHGANVNWRNASYGNPLHTANERFRQPCLELLRTLISAGADVHARNMFGERPVECLIKSRNRTMEEIKLFLENGCHVNIFDPISDEGFLAVALNQSQEFSVYQMVSKAPEMEEIDNKGRNAIHNVVSLKRPDWVEFEIAEELGELYPSSDKYIETIRSLMSLGLNINQQDCEGSTPLHKAAKMQNLTGMVGLLENEADINILDTNGKPAFAYSLELAQLHKEPKEHDVLILNVISSYLLKLNLASAKINISNRAVDIQIREKYPLNASKVEAINSEVEKMKSEVMNLTSVTYYEFLSDTGAVGNFPYMLLCKQEAIKDLFHKNIESIRKKFPEFTRRLQFQYEKALSRCKIIDTAVTSLNDLVGFNMPGICSKIILRFLDNNELNNLIDSATV